MLQLENVVKYYRGADDHIRAVDDVDLDVSPGEMVALHGPSGSGKTTLLMLIAGLLNLDAGFIRYAGSDIASLSNAEMCEYLMRDVGFMYQRARLIPKISTVENAAQKLLMGGVAMREARYRSIPWLESVGLDTRLGHTPERLSVGERQRVAIARTLAAEPKLILADEPTGSLDTERGMQILQLLSLVAHEWKACVLLVTHDPIAAAVADRCCTLRDGKLTHGSPSAPSETPTSLPTGATGARESL